MFDDFRSSATSTQSRKRFGASMAIAVVLYGGASAGVVAASTAVRHVEDEFVCRLPYPQPPRPPLIAPLIPPVELAGNASPKYSSRALRKGVEGAVVVTFEVLEDGRVANPRIISGPEELHEAVLETVLEWRFQPARRGTTGVRHRLTRLIRFRLERRVSVTVQAPG